ncbi:rod shape-determining protein MreD [Bacteroidales bacterium Barb4]|nr:rod shape-determining protein MreD [Bacteroidales bacterium Barb4]
MINHIIRSLFYFFVFVLVQVLFLNQIHFLRMAMPFLYVYFLLKLPVGTLRIYTLLLSFLTGLTVDFFCNTPGMHAAACMCAGFVREPVISFFIGKDLSADTSPSYSTFKYGGFMRYTLAVVLVHHFVLLMIESMTLFDFWFLLLRILLSVVLTCGLIFAVELIDVKLQKGEK